jgi:hypothetical protein
MSLVLTQLDQLFDTRLFNFISGLSDIIICQFYRNVLKHTVHI